MIDGSALEHLRTEIGALTAEWRAACASDDLEPAGGDPFDRGIVLAIVAAILDDSPSSARAAELDRAADAISEGDVPLEVVIHQLGCLRELIQRRLGQELAPDALQATLQRLNSAIDGLVSRCASSTAKRLEEAAFLDPLTGLLNRRALDRDLARDLAQVHRAGRRLSLIMIDLDGLKEVNDSQGHAAGDSALCRLADSISAALRGGDSAYRLGGDEFVVLLVDTPLDDVPAVVQRIAASSPPRFSWGAAAASAHGTADALVDAADRHLLDRRRSAGMADPRRRAAASLAPAGGRWEGRPVLAGALRAVAFAVPLVAALTGGLTVATILPRPITVAGTVIWWVTVLAASGFALVVFDAVARRVLPLAALLKLSMVFPDRAPSRFGVALRSGSTKILRDRAIVELREGHQEPAVAARTILALAASLNTHDRNTRGHSERVRAYADMIGEQMGLPPADRDRLRWAALLHDVGKLSVPSRTLNSHDELTEDDWDVLRRHPLEGARLAKPLQEWLGAWSAAIEQHHERFDGKGYPFGLAGQELSLGARIVAVADSYDAMTSARSYSSGMSAAQARAELARKAGSDFDPAVVRAFLNVALGRLRWVMGPLAFISAVPILTGFGAVRRSLDTVGRTVALSGVSLISTAGLVQAVHEPMQIDAPAVVQQNSPSRKAAAEPRPEAPLPRELPLGEASDGEVGSSAPAFADDGAVTADGLSTPGSTSTTRPATGSGASRPAADPAEEASPTTSRPPPAPQAGGGAAAAPAGGSRGGSGTAAPKGTPATTTTQPACPPRCRYVFDGFFSPVSSTETNFVNAGASIPFKWKLTDDDGKIVKETQVVRSAEFDGVTPDYKLSYSEEDAHFLLLAKTDQSWAGSEKVFRLTLDDNSVYEAVFRFDRGSSKGGNSSGNSSGNSAGNRP